MTLTPVFHGRVTDDMKLVLFDTERSQRRTWLATLKGKVVEVIVRKVRTQRSLDQNDYIHVVATALSEHCGYTLAEMKLILMGECWGWHTVGNRELPVKIHTSDMTTEEASYFIEWVVPWANEHFPECRVTYPEKKKGERRKSFERG